MDREKMAGRVDEDSRDWAVDFRHLVAFQWVYQEKNYANAGYGIFTTRKSIVRMMQNLERSFDSPLFTEGLKGELVPGPFAERLYNDLRFLTAARHRMKDHVTGIHENGRIVHVGTSAAVFRTREFRNLFRGLQSLEGIRACYTSIEMADAGKSLISGHCDIYIGGWAGGSRFVTQDAAVVSFRRYRRGTAEHDSTRAGDRFRVPLDGQMPGKADEEWQTLEESRWLYWLDHPEECPVGTVILGPDVQIDGEFWQTDESEIVGNSLPLLATFLRQHPYEFLPTLMAKILTRPQTA